MLLFFIVHYIHYNYSLQSKQTLNPIYYHLKGNSKVLLQSSFDYKGPLYYQNYVFMVRNNGLEIRLHDHSP